MNSEMIEIEVAYAKPTEQVIIKLKLPPDSTAEYAVKQSGLLVQFPEINLTELKFGIFGIVCKAEHILKQGDRVEIYRPLLSDPKEARRQRAVKK